MTGPTIGDLIAKHREIKAYVEAEEAALKERLRDHKAALMTIQTALGVMLQTEGLQNFKTDDGTAYLRHDDGLKVDSQPEFLNFVRVHERWDLANVSLLVDPIREYREKHNGELPPGVVSNPSITCIIRR